MKTLRLFTALLGVLLLAISSCTKDAPSSVYNPNTSFGGPPNVTTIVPENAPYILGGLTTILINGTNFGTDTSKVHVFFNSTKVSLSSITATQIKLLAPLIIQDSIRVRVSIDGSDKFSDLKYVSIRSVMTLIKDIDTAKQVPNAITFNKNGDLFVSVVTSAGVSDGIYQLSSGGGSLQFATKGTESYFSGLKFRGDSLYAARRANRLVSRNTVNGSMNIFTASFPAAALPINIEDFDYDQQRVMWAAGNTSDGGILRIDSLKNVKKFPFPGIIHSVRVFNGALYVSNESSTDSTKAVYQIPMNTADTSLGTAVKYFDLSATVGNKTNIVFGITFDSQGNLYAGTDAPAGIYVVATDKSVQPLYNSLVGPNCQYLAWGNDSYLYAVRVKASSTSRPTGLFKIDMLGKVTAPYYGQ
ncbi:MAG: IPT/TIG domain-containing protein [Bacteroidota bacterium]|nr:IPT/TIG domain-containing protein [Bacteroidota bacterium]